MDKYKAFFEMASKWTVSDYQTPKIKSEVIIDMLISEFIEEIISYGISHDAPPNLHLIAKEFPIPRVGQDKLRHKGDSPTNGDTRQYASVDFLLTDSKDKPTTLYFVELKTTDDSFDGKQLLNMLWTCNQGTASLYHRFYDLIKYHVEQKKGKKTHRIKYKYMLEKMYKKQEQSNHHINTDGIEMLLLDGLEKWENDIDCKFVYLSLNDNKLDIEDIEALIKKGKGELTKTQQGKIVDVDFKTLSNNYKHPTTPLISLKWMDDGFVDYLKRKDAKDKTCKHKAWLGVKEILSLLERVLLSYQKM